MSRAFEPYEGHIRQYETGSVTAWLGDLDQGYPVAAVQLLNLPKIDSGQVDPSTRLAKLFLDRCLCDPFAPSGTQRQNG
ncbi:hypothetical protein CLCR_03777 [Cladophialophora carrionii]|uniref:Uncharacterized protein n=1 Tax=Cladophialophora carrionii TaxID=86049 RepID=A0A1C1CGB3_9EURO|nr:hypothetical protein CLCR_03777 [Cladophialophora carrionii]